MAGFFKKERFMTITNMAKSPRAKKLPYQCYLEMKLKMDTYVQNKVRREEKLVESEMEDICFKVFEAAVDKFHREPAWLRDDIKAAR
jgi:hypothetical protein